MRTVTFQSVYEGVLRRHGLDPIGDAITQDTARSVAEKITQRVRTGWEAWDMPEFTRTEERAFRPSWDTTRQYRRIGSDLGLPDEIYWAPAPLNGYYRVVANAPTDPPIGTVPTNPIYFIKFTPEPFIERDQLDQNALGEVLGVYRTDPSLELDAGLSIALPFRPSERGIRVAGNYGDTVFVWYRVPPPKFSKKPWINGRSYVPGDRVYYQTGYTGGECYSCLIANKDGVPGVSGNWMLEPMPETLSQYIIAGAYADCLKESVLNKLEPQVRLANMAAAEAEAQTSIYREIDKLVGQGQKHFYGGNNWRRFYGIWNPQPWGGDKVAVLGYPRQPSTPPRGPKPPPPPPIPPDPDSDTDAPSQPTGSFIYAPQIKSLSGPAAPQLNTYPTVALGVDTMIVIWTGQQARVTAGPVDPTDPGQVLPLDYDPLKNDKHWEEVI